MFTTLKLTAWILVGTGLIVNVAFLADPNSGRYPLWALLPIIGALILIIPILRNGRKQGRR